MFKINKANEKLDTDDSKGSILTRPTTGLGKLEFGCWITIYKKM